MAADGSGKTDLTCTVEAEIQPAWSPDGTKIAYVRSGDVWAMNADGSGQTPLTSTPQFESLPDWSPDGMKIVYQKGAAAIWVMNADGSGQTGLGYHGPGWEGAGLVARRREDHLLAQRGSASRLQHLRRQRRRHRPDFDSVDGQR